MKFDVARGRYRTSKPGQELLENHFRLEIRYHQICSTAEYPATWVNLFLHMSRSLKICAQVESGTVVAGYSAVAPLTCRQWVLCLQFSFPKVRLGKGREISGKPLQQPDSPALKRTMGVGNTSVRFFIYKNWNTFGNEEGFYDYLIECEIGVYWASANSHAWNNSLVWPLNSWDSYRASLINNVKFYHAFIIQKEKAKTKTKK